MIHFAYPNAQPRTSEFLGCGRFVASRVKPNDAYEPVRLNIPNIQEVHTAVTILAPDSMNCEKPEIYEKRDNPESVFIGESMDLAFTLAAVSRSRRLKPEFDEFSSDIWCTGRIDLKDDRHPFLQAVKTPGFTIKLDAFLSGKNKDKVFIAPSGNIHPEHEAMIMESNARLLSLKDAARSGIDLKTKTVLKAGGNELALLVGVLFRQPIVKRKWPIFAVFAAVLLFASALWFHYSVKTDLTGRWEFLGPDGTGGLIWKIEHDGNRLLIQPEGGGNSFYGRFTERTKEFSFTMPIPMTAGPPSNLYGKGEIDDAGNRILGTWKRDGLSNRFFLERISEGN